MQRRWALKVVLALFFLYAGVGLALAQENLPQLVKRVRPAVVTILIHDAHGKIKKSGSGFFINPEGHLISNFHVLKGYQRAEIKTADGRRYPIKEVIAADPHADLVLFTAHSPRGTKNYLYLSRARPEVGQRVVVVGSPMGLDQTVSDGMVSAIRHTSNFGEIIQISAPISPGSSGGPVVNLRGEVMGVVFSHQRRGQNLNFAIPASRIQSLEPGTGGLVKDPQAGRWGGASEAENEAEAKKLFNRGLNYFNAGNYEKAAHTYRRALELKPDDVVLLNNLAVAYLRLKRLEEAADACQQAIRLKPGYYLPHYNLGMVYYQQNRFQQAAGEFKQAIRFKPGYPPAHFNLGLAYVGMGDKGAALEEHRILQKLDPKLAAKFHSFITR
ncbi:MAG: trypsin-like peptidase domain-containing protein [Thermodesulfobacteriota bacterium]